LPAGAKVSFYEMGNVRIRYAEIGSGFPLLATPGGGLNSCIAVWARAVINIPEEFKNDFRVITMDQRNATGGESTGPVPVDDPWGAFADDQLGVMDHLGINKFAFFGNCIGGPFAMKLMERAPQRVAAAILSQPVGHHPANPDYMYDAGKTVWAKELRERRPDVSTESIERYLHNLYRVRPDFVYSVSRDFAKSCQTSMRARTAFRHETPQAARRLPRDDLGADPRHPKAPRPDGDRDPAARRGFPHAGLHRERNGGTALQAPRLHQYRHRDRHQGLRLLDRAWRHLHGRVADPAYRHDV
jgi:pimeloyl-ACP methyl ester carboxylesterase